MSRPRRPVTALIGAGRLAGAIAPLLRDAGYPLRAVASPGGRSARRLARRLGGVRASADPLRAAADARLVLLAVPDGAVAAVAGELAGAPFSWRGRTVLHHAGALGTEPLAPLALAGAATGVLHPLQALPASRTARAALRGSGARIEGDRTAAAVARRLARDLGLRPFRLPPAAGRRGRELYHAAAALASNDVLALVSLGVSLFERLGLPRRTAAQALLHLASGAVEQATRLGLEGSLTGPVVRGDVETLARHLARLGPASPRAAAVHRALSRELLELVGERLAPRQRAALRRMLD